MVIVSRMWWEKKFQCYLLCHLFSLLPIHYLLIRHPSRSTLFIDLDCKFFKVKTCLFVCKMSITPWIVYISALTCYWINRRKMYHVSQGREKGDTKSVQPKSFMPAAHGGNRLFRPIWITYWRSVRYRLPSIFSGLC